MCARANTSYAQYIETPSSWMYASVGYKPISSDAVLKSNWKLAEKKVYIFELNIRSIYLITDNFFASFFLIIKMHFKWQYYAKNKLNKKTKHFTPKKDRLKVIHIQLIPEDILLMIFFFVAV